MAKAQHEDIEIAWDLNESLSQEVNIDLWAVNNTVRLLEEDNTIPFIARYRQEQTGNMEASKIRELKEHLDELKSVQSKIVSATRSIEKLGKLTPRLKQALASSKTMTEVDHLYAPYKASSKRSLAERAREAGLEQYANQVLQRPRDVNLSTAVRPAKEGLKTIKEVTDGVQHILADIFSKDKMAMDLIRKLCRTSLVQLKSTLSKSAKDAKETKGAGKPVDGQKFHLYFDFSASIRHIKPHQVLAINRGESLKVLTVKIDIPDSVEQQYKNFCRSHFLRPGAGSHIAKLVDDSAQDAYRRLIAPLMCRHFRSDMTKAAEKASVDVFCANLHRLLLTPPVRGRVVMGMDPGFRNGCKFAVTSNTGEVLGYGVSYLHTGGSKQMEVDKIKRALISNRCETVAIGNGTACRETESFFSDHIARGTFKPLNVSYCIVNEAGASIYSASDLAKQEMPDLDINIIGAVSIARRLQDPIAEYVKIEARHLGVGMYQHDVSEKLMKNALDGVVEECVSFVGVDLNVCSEHLLMRVAGLGAAKAKKVLAWRQENGSFVNREELKSVKGLGPKAFEQCAGFVRILPETRRRNNVCDENEMDPKARAIEGGKKRRAPTKVTSAKSKKAKAAASLQPNNLDMTSVHPESYQIAERLIELVGLQKEGIGSESFIAAVKSFMKRRDLESLARELDAGVPTVTLLVDGLQQTIDHDIREVFEKPLFKQGLVKMSDLARGQQLTGRVVNVVHFGAFVDVGVGRDGLIHSSRIPPRCLNGQKALQLGDKVECQVEGVDLGKQQIQLTLLRLLA